MIATARIRSAFFNELLREPDSMKRCGPIAISRCASRVVRSDTVFRERFVLSLESSLA